MRFLISYLRSSAFICGHSCVSYPCSSVFIRGHSSSRSRPLKTRFIPASQALYIYRRERIASHPPIFPVPLS